MTNSWFACEQAERPPDPYVLWHYEGCGTCMFKIDVQRHLFPDDPHVEVLHRLLFAAAS